VHETTSTRKPFTAMRVALATLLLLGCSGTDGYADEDAQQREHDSQSQELALGSQGPQVEALHQQLAMRGYLPNEELAQLRPQWRPIVETAPTDPSVFDESTDLAVRSFQANYGLEATGRVDASMRAILAEHACGTPDGIDVADPTHKWAPGGNFNFNDNVTWAFTGFRSSDTTSTKATLRALAAAALATWEEPSRFSFTQINPIGGVDLQIFFSPTRPGGLPWNGFAAWATDRKVYLNPSAPFSLDNSPSSTEIDLQSVLLHEIGHLLSLNHSGYSSAVMYGSLNNGTKKRNLTADDRVGIIAKESKFAATISSVLDVAAKSSANSRTLYILFGQNGNGGREIWRRVDGAWEKLPGRAVRIAVGTTAWAVNSADQLYQFNESTKQWVFQQGVCAKDVGAYGSQVWIITCTPTNGGFTIQQKTSSGWTTVDGGAVRIGVGPDKFGLSSTVPWAVNSVGQIYRRTSGAWEWLALPPALVARDITASGGTAWVVMQGAGLWVFNEQPSSNVGSPAAPEIKTWRPVGEISSGELVGVAADALGFPTVVDDSGKVFETR